MGASVFASPCICIVKSRHHMAGRSRSTQPSSIFWSPPCFDLENKTDMISDYFKKENGKRINEKACVCQTD